jgi:flagellar basal-body rod protein FlgB
MTSISDLAMRTMEATLGGLQKRIDVRSNNVANSATPQFRAQQVDFESALSEALGRGQEPTDVDPALSPAPNMPNVQGNTVDLGSDMVGMIKDNLAYDTAVSVFNYKAGILAAALRGQS